MKKLKALCLICVMLTILCSCVTAPIVVESDPPILPTKPDRVILGDDGNVNEYRLIVQDIRWRKWAFYVEWTTGIITDEEYKIEVEKLEGLLAEYDKIFEMDLDSSADP